MQTQGSDSAAVAMSTVYYRTFSGRHPPCRRVRTGERVVTQTIDASGRDARGEVCHPESGNPLTGPFFIEGAEPGDAVCIHIHALRLNRDWGYTKYRLIPEALEPAAVEALYPRNYKPDEVIPGRSDVVRWNIDRGAGTVRLHEPHSERVDLHFPAVPMLGCIGVAPAGDFSPTSTPAGSYGGNLDYNEVREGASVILPGYHPGALLFVGDGHALMADGEPCGNGVETSMDVEFSVDLRKQAAPRGPRIENVEWIISIGAQAEFVSSLDRALQMATTDMIEWLTGEYRLEPWAAHLLIAMQGRYDVVTVAGSMALRIPKKYLPCPKPD